MGDESISYRGDLGEACRHLPRALGTVMSMEEHGALTGKWKTCPGPKTATAAAAPCLHLAGGKQASAHCQQKAFCKLSVSVPSSTLWVTTQDI